MVSAVGFAISDACMCMYSMCVCKYVSLHVMCSWCVRTCTHAWLHPCVCVRAEVVGGGLTTETLFTKGPQEARAEPPSFLIGLNSLPRFSESLQLAERSRGMGEKCAGERN